MRLKLHSYNTNHYPLIWTFNRDCEGHSVKRASYFGGGFFASNNTILQPNLRCKSAESLSWIHRNSNVMLSGILYSFTDQRSSRIQKRQEGVNRKWWVGKAHSLGFDRRPPSLSFLDLPGCEWAKKPGCKRVRLTHTASRVEFSHRNTQEIGLNFMCVWSVIQYPVPVPYFWSHRKPIQWCWCHPARWSQNKRHTKLWAWSENDEDIPSQRRM